MNAALKYDSAWDQYVEDDTNVDATSRSCSESESVHQFKPVLVLKKCQQSSKFRPFFIDRHNVARIVRRSGRRNVFLTKLPNKNVSYLRDLMNTLLTIRWRWILIALLLVNFVCFMLFGTLWWVVAAYSGDFEKNGTDVCIVNANTMTGYVLLSVETITTIGYGYRYPTENCHGAWLMLSIQVILGVAIQGVLVSAVYAKVSKPFTHHTSLFSRKAVICLKDGQLRFVFRLNDFSHKILCGTKIQLYFINKENVTSLEPGQLKLIDLVIEPYGLPIFPLEVEHVIDERSPLWNYGPMQILQLRFEIIAVAEGISTTTGQVSQNRTSYSNSDIYWGHRFTQCVTFDEQSDAYVVNYKNFNKMLRSDTPLCSAKQLGQIKETLHEM